MKACITSDKPKRFEPVEVTFTLEAEEELNAFITFLHTSAQDLATSAGVSAVIEARRLLSRRNPNGLINIADKLKTHRTGGC